LLFVRVGEVAFVVGVGRVVVAVAASVGLPILASFVLGLLSFLVSPLVPLAEALPPLSP